MGNILNLKDYRTPLKNPTYTIMIGEKFTPARCHVEIYKDGTNGVIIQAPDKKTADELYIFCLKELNEKRKEYEETGAVKN